MDFSSFDELEKLLYELSKQPKKGKVDAELVSPAVYKPDTTRANTLRIEQCTGYSGDVVYEDPRLVVIEPKNHRDSCCYGEKSKRRWCVSDP